MAIRQKAQPYIIVECRGGVVVAVTANRGVQMVIVDWDNLKDRIEHPGAPGALDLPLILEARINAVKVHQADKAIDKADFSQFIKIMEGE